jgi:hypothetical protein
MAARDWTTIDLALRESATVAHARTAFPLVGGAHARVPDRGALATRSIRAATEPVINIWLLLEMFGASYTAQCRRLPFASITGPFRGRRLSAVVLQCGEDRFARRLREEW